MIELHAKSGADAAAALTQIKLIATRFPGEHELTLTVEHQDVDRFVREPGLRSIPVARRRLKLGPTWLYDASEACLAALREFGDVAVRDG